MKIIVQFQSLVCFVLFRPNQTTFLHDAPFPLPSFPEVAASPGCLLAPQCQPSTLLPKACLQLSMTVCAMSYICSKWRGGWMLATESVDDSEKMTGLWRREVLGVKKGKDSEERGGARGEGSGGEKWWGELKGCICWKGLDEGGELGWNEDVKWRMGTFCPILTC